MALRPARLRSAFAALALLSALPFPRQRRRVAVSIGLILKQWISDPMVLLLTNGFCRRSKLLRTVPVEINELIASYYSKKLAQKFTEAELRAIDELGILCCQSQTVQVDREQCERSGKCEFRAGDDADCYLLTTTSEPPPTAPSTAQTTHCSASPPSAVETCTTRWHQPHRPS